MNKSRARRFIFFALALTLTSCTLVPKSDPQTVYQLAALPSKAGAQYPKVPYSLSIDTPQSSRIIDSTRMLVQPDGTQLSIYKGARWSDSVPSMLRERFSAAFRQANAFHAVSNDGYAYRTDLALGTEVMTFQVQYLPQGVFAVVTIDAFLSDPSSQTILATQRFSATHPLAGTAVTAAVRALSEATNNVTQSLVDWTLGQVRSYEPARPS